MTEAATETAPKVDAVFAKPTTTVLIRPASSSDQAFVLDSWLRSFGQGRTWFWRGVHGDRFYSGHRKIAEDLLSRGLVLVACLEQVPDAVLGWMCVEGDCLHYVYVKSKYRKKGVARELLRHAQGLLGKVENCSHQTGQFKRWSPGAELNVSPGHAYYKPTKEKHES